jgi:RNA 2',3'-cyclic 3'-phosphodiesterase
VSLLLFPVFLVCLLLQSVVALSVGVFVVRFMEHNPSRHLVHGNVHRIFIGVLVPPSVEEAVASAYSPLRSQLEATGVRLSWIPPDNYHITLHFIGDVAEEKVHEVQAALSHTDTPCPFDISIQDAGAFTPRRPRIVFAAVQAGADQANLLSDCVRSALGAGSERGDNFHAHITLARIKSPQLDARKLMESLAAFSTSPIVFSATSFVLFESVPDGHRTRYKVLQEYPLRELI